MTDSNKGLCILIVEDNPGDQNLITELLNASVIKIQLLTIAGTLAKAIDTLQKEIFDIILLDLSLPDSSGIETFKTVKQSAGKMPVIILSGVTDMNISVEAISLGAQDYHIKGDLDEKILAKTILYSIERKRKLENLRESNERYITLSKAELDLMQSEEITRQIMNGALDAIICIDIYGKITVWNPQAEKIFGWKQPEILGKTLTETIIPLEFREKHERGIKQYHATGEGMILNKLIEVTAMNREEKHFPAELTFIPLTENGNHFFCAFIRDITERKKAEEDIHLSHQRLKNAELIGKTGYWHWDIKTGKVSWSEGTYYVFGEKPGNFKENFEDFIRRVQLEDRERVQKIVQEVYENKKPANYEFWIETPDGEKKYISTTAEVNLIDNGDVVSMFGTTYDNTEHKKAQEKESKNFEQQKILTELIKAVSRVQKIEDIYELALSGLQDSIGADKASVLLFDGNNIMRFVASGNLSDKYKKAADGHSPWKANEKDAKPIFIPDVLKEPSLQNLLPVINEEGICALGFIPLIHQQQLLGKFMVYFTSVHHFTEEEIQLVQNIASNIAFTIWEKKSAIALIESETKYRTLMQQAGDSILVFTGSGQLAEANESARQLLGYSREEYKKMSLMDLFYEEDIKQNPLRFDLLNKGESTVNRRRLKRKDGAALVTEIHAKKLSDGRYIGVGRDLTERIKAEEQLRESEEKYRTLVEHASDGIIITGTNGICIEANSTICNMLGYTKEELSNRNLFELLILNKGDVPLRFVEVLAGKSVLQERNVLKKDGTILSVELNSKLLPDNRILGIVRDISERRQIEDALRQSNERNEIVAKATSDVVWDWDLVTGKVYRSKEGLKKVYGYDDNAPIELATDWNQRIHPDDREMIDKMIEKIHQNPDQNIFSEEYRFLRQDGTYVNVFDRGYIIRDEHGKPVRMIGAAQNITERKTAEEKIRASEEQYRDLVDNITDLICTHDLDGRVLSVNKAAEKLIGYKFNPKDNLNVKDILTADTKNKFNRYIAEIQKKGHVKGLMKVQTHAGDIRIWEYNNSLKTTGAGTPVVRGYARDITERKKAEDLIKKQKEQYDDLVTNIPVGIYKFRMKPDGSMSLDYISPRLCKMIGVKEEDAYRHIMNAFKVVHPDDFSRFMELIEESYNTKQNFLWKGRTIIEGQVKWVKIESSPKVLKDGDILWDGVIADITERKKAEERIRINEVRLTKAQQIGKLGYWQQEINSNMIWGSEEAKKIYGFPPVAGELASETIAACIPDFAKVRQAAIDLLKDDKKYGIEFLINPADGSPARYISAVSEIEKNEQGEPLRFMGVLRDITESKKAELSLKESEEKYRSLIEQASDPILIYSPDGKIKDYNNAFMTTTGYQKKDIENLRLTDFLFEEDLKDIPLHFGKLKKGISVHDERRARKKDGSAVPVELNSKMMPDGNIMVIARDVTDRKKAEEEILKTNARFQMLSKATSDIVWDWDMASTSIWWNDNYYSLMGIKKEKKITDINDWYSRIHPDDLNRIKKDVKKGMHGNLTFWSHEYRFAKADGTYLNFLDRSFVMRSGDGKPYRIIGSMVNMTPVYAAQRKVAESENRLRTIYETEPECIKVLGSKGELLEMNQAGLDMIEADNLKMVKGKSVLGIIAQPYRKAFDKLIRDVFKGRSGVLEFEIVGLKGTHRWLETHAVPMLDATGTITALLGITRNVTERKLAEEAVKLSEEKYRTMIEQAPDGIFISGQNTFIIDANDSGCSMLGYTKEELLKIKYTDLIVPENLQNKPIRYDKLNSGKIVLSERKLIRKDGSIISVEINAKLRSDGRYQSFIRDITSRRKAEQELEESYKAIRKLTAHLQNIREEERAHMAREIHDELGQQLTVLKMDISWINKKIGIQDEPVKARMKELLVMLDETVKSVRRISSELRPSLLDDLGLTAAMEWQLTEFEKRFEIKTHFKPDDAEIKLPESMKTALFRIFQESLTNVARHSKAKKVTISLILHNSSIVLSVVDNGVGFDKQNSIGKKTLGILGMQERTAMLGGIYEISGKPGKGTKVVVRIPLTDNNKN